MKARKSNSKTEQTTNTNKGEEMFTKGTRFRYDDYEMVYEGDGVWSCVGTFTDKEVIAEPLFSLAVEKLPLRSNVVDARRDTLMADDFGPQRFCAGCGVKLEERTMNQSLVGELPLGAPHTRIRPVEFTRLEHDDSGWTRTIRSEETKVHSYYGTTVYFHPTFNNGEDECELEGLEVDDTCLTSGDFTHTNMEMDDLRNVYRNLKGKDLEWYNAHKDEVKALYKACDEGKPMVGDTEILPFIYNDDGDMVDFNEDEVNDRWDAPIRKDGVSMLTNEEQWLRGYASYVLAFNPDKVLDKVKTTKNVRHEISQDIEYLAKAFKHFKLVHPKLVRRYRQYPTNWKAMQYQVAKQERLNLEAEAFLHQDWELASRQHECALVHCLA